MKRQPTTFVGIWCESILDTEPEIKTADNGEIYVHLTDSRSSRSPMITLHAADRDELLALADWLIALAETEVIEVQS